MEQVQTRKPEISMLEQVQASQPEISILDIIRILWKNKITICIVTFLITVLAITYTFKLKDEFSSVTIFITKTSNPTNQNLSGLASLAGISLGNQSNVAPSEYLDKVIQDEEFLTQLTNRKWLYKGDSLYLYQIYEIKPDTSNVNWKFIFERSKIDLLRNNGIIVLSKDKKTGLPNLTVNTPDAKLSYDINKYTIDLISNYIRNSITSQAKEKREFIEKRLAEAKPVLEASENSLAHFKERNFSGSSPDLVLAEMRLRRELTLNQELYIEFKKQYEIALIDEKNDQTLIQIIKKPEVPITRSKPKSKELVLMGFALGLFLGCLAAFLLEWTYTNKTSILKIFKETKA